MSRLVSEEKINLSKVMMTTDEVASDKSMITDIDVWLTCINITFGYNNCVYRRKGGVRTF